MGQGAEDFLGTQGDPWDTPSDMSLRPVGALTTFVTVAFSAMRYLLRYLITGETRVRKLPCRIRLESHKPATPQPAHKHHIH
ncbi:DUF2238 domain-containing protein [Shigella flexneri]